MHPTQETSDNEQRQPFVVLLGPTSKRRHTVADSLRIDPEFKALIPPLSAIEFSTLEASIQEKGCRDPLVVWTEEKILIDGHHRYAICTARDIPYQTVEMSFEDRNAVKAWMLLNQLGRRNLTSESVSYLRGTWYELAKQSRGGDRKSSGHFDHLKTEEKLGALFLASPKTIRRDAEFAKAVDTLSFIGGEDMKRKILTRSAGMTKKQVIALANDARSRPAKVAKTLQEFENRRDRQVKPEGEPAIAHHLTLKIGSLVEVYAPDREDVNGRLGRIQSVGEKTATVWMRHIPTITMQLYTFKHSALTAVPLDNQPGLQEICDRTDRLHKLGNLDPFEV
ncbi:MULTISPECIES: ParB/RepB/Spo0J family partition protein [unclassified Microcoleus]|uniref:ParB/RepB/Spo0J family partition protein n=1 Tax=unclassified Microcoleus TaxID=2642155 RepID=UPI0025E65C49|nr:MULTISPECIES: ParB/RepB/Spo0J family partition protein [unclassified Microcoleus]